MPDTGTSSAPRLSGYGSKKPSRSSCRCGQTLCIVRDTDEDARAQIPPGAEIAYPGDLGRYGLVGTIDTIRDRIAAYGAAGVQELAIGFEDPASPEHVRQRG
jgi:alkanesulfonate monooxygenase SsuD/methylene tetrahydromethanopterin reductase-like flavin-dependent oxidoreductase (luciferase family)